MLEELVGRRIKDLRERHGWTQQKLAVMLGMESERQIRKWEKGEHLPRSENLIALAKAFNVRVKDLFDFPDSGI